MVNIQFYNYDLQTTEFLSSYSANGSPTSVLLGYKSSLPIAKISNAIKKTSYINSVISKKETFFIPPFTGQNRSTVFTTAADGTITIAIAPGGYLGSGGSNGVTCKFIYTLYGPGPNKIGNLCRSSSSSNCTFPASVTYTNMPAGIYTLTISPSTNTSAEDVPVDYEYPAFEAQINDSTEFFYNGFEDYSFASYGQAHTGKAYWDGTYHIYYNPPNNRNYIIQWWSRSGSKWEMHEQPYTGPMSLSGIIDDVRVFPSDALLTTYTYDPLIGKTGEVDPAGNTITYEYDGLGRSKVTRDGDGNILSQTEYHYEGQP